MQLQKEAQGTTWKQGWCDWFESVICLALGSDCSTSSSKGSKTNEIKEMSTIAEAAHLLMCSLDNEAGEKKKRISSLGADTIYLNRSVEISATLQRNSIP